MWLSSLGPHVMGASSIVYEPGMNDDKGVFKPRTAFGGSCGTFLGRVGEEWYTAQHELVGGGGDGKCTKVAIHFRDPQHTGLGRSGPGFASKFGSSSRHMLKVGVRRCSRNFAWDTTKRALRKLYSSSKVVQIDIELRIMFGVWRMRQPVSRWTRPLIMNVSLLSAKTLG